jgi:hypothetical protein
MAQQSYLFWTNSSVCISGSHEIQPANFIYCIDDTLYKIVEGVSFGEPSERDGASSRNFLARKYPCDTKLIPRKIL